MWKYGNRSYSALFRLFLPAVQLLFFFALQGPEQREQNHIADGTRVGQQHGQAIDAHAFARGRRQSVRQRANVVLVHLVSFFVAARAFVELLLEAPALLLGIVQLAEGVADLKSANEDLETLDPLGVLFGLALVLREWRNRERKIVDEGRLNEVRLGDKLENLGDRLAIRRSSIVGNVRIRRIVAMHHGGDLLGAGKIGHLRLVPSVLGPELDDGFAHGEPLEVCKINFVPIEVRDGCAVDVARHLRQHLGGEVHHVAIVRVGHVELQHGELGIVLRRDALVAEVAINLVDAVHAADHQPLQVKLGRNAQIQIDVERVVVGDERLCHRAAGDGMHHRRLDFDEAIGVQKSPHRLYDFGAFQEDLAHLGVHRQVNVAAAIARLHVLQAVPFLGQRKQVLHQESDLLHVDGQLVGAGAEKIALHADVVAKVEQLVKLKRLFADVVEADVNLQPLPALLQVSEARFALHADGHQASRDADVHAWRLELGAGLGRVP